MSTLATELSEPIYEPPTLTLLDASAPVDFAYLQIESARLLRTCQYELALPYTLALLDSLKQLGNNNAYLSAFCQLMTIYEQAGIFPNYVESLSFAIEILGESAPAVEIAQTNLAIGRLYHLLEDFDQAQIYYAKSFEIQRHLLSDVLSPISYRYMAETYAAKDEMPEALESIGKSIHACNQVQNPLLIASSMNTFGDLLIVNNQMNGANRKFTLGLQAAQTAANPYERIRALIGLGIIHFKQNKVDLALSIWQQAYSLAARHHCHSLLAKVTRVLATTHKLQESYKVASEYFEIFIQEDKLLSLQSFATQLRNLESSQKIEIINRRNLQLRHEIQERMKSQAELEVLATTDPMTGLFNRRHFFTLTEHWCENATEIPLEISAMMIDIDHFKRINDEYGHPAGDEVLIKVAQAIQNALRTDDILCRYGGEEFSILLPNTNLMAAQQVAERVRQTVENMKIYYEDHVIQLTVSIGVADLLNSPKHSVMGLLGHADQALFKAKHKGRNCCAVFSSQNPSQD
ncbi:MAG: hypothetical protein BGO78_07850 [Chloroflexi bacterium 44-23]|nr:MAG: hypothetical protein BGO78_07850 [Chloroflexi bacterium 44-23]